eukprot:m.16451 g.16451  ORF g.16451 m.16451 type:complete len:78 (-) comp7077_c0_seq2:1455-1688(-)
MLSFQANEVTLNTTSTSVAWKLPQTYPFNIFGICAVSETTEVLLFLALISYFSFFILCVWNGTVDFEHVTQVMNLSQ